MDSELENNRFVIRPMTSKDAAAVSGLTSELGYERPAAETAEWIRMLPSRAETQAAFVACVANEVAGWIEVSITHHLQVPPFALIGGLVVKDGFRGMKIGQRLCQRAEAWAWERGMEMMRVTSRSTRADAHRFYLRDGYSIVKTSLVFKKSRPQQPHK